MKFILLLSALTLLSVQANAAGRCGSNLREVSQIVNQQYPKLNTSVLVACFKGNWGYGVVIGFDTPLVFDGEQFEACPQPTGGLVLKKKSGGGSGGYLVCKDGSMSARGFSGSLSMANGEWTKQGSSVASARNSNN